MGQIMNPYLPLNEYVPDGEPHLFNGRVYIYGSHDRAHGTRYCEGDYVTWSAGEDDLSDWRYEGVIYRRTQDPSNAEDKMQLWAPDVTRGPDGRYYLYYCYSFYPEIGVAVSNSPAGPFEFYGHVKYPEHIENGKTLREFMPFDPAVLTDEDGHVYLYYGFAPAEEKEINIPQTIPEDTPEEMREALNRLAKVKFGENGMAVELEPDMITTKGVPKACIPGGHYTAGTGFEGHGFFEASSIRKINGRYYFVYSSHKSHELCYATSDRPTEGYVFGGTLVSNGDMGFNGRSNPVNTLGNNHGGMVQANGKWYIFYHRQTNGTEFSRQGCAEEIVIRPDGSIGQVEITSCGLNRGPLKGEGEYPAAIACHLTCPQTLNYIDYQNPVMRQQTKVTEDAEKNEQYITDVKNGSKIGYKYFEFMGTPKIELILRGHFSGNVSAALSEDGAELAGEAALSINQDDWMACSVPVKLSNATHAIYLTFAGEGALDFKSIIL